MSDISSICAWVLQGGIAALLLLNLFTAEHTITQKMITGHFSDDIALLTHHFNPEMASYLLQRHLY